MYPWSSGSPENWRLELEWSSGKPYVKRFQQMPCTFEYLEFGNYSLLPFQRSQLSTWNTSLDAGGSHTCAVEWFWMRRGTHTLIRSRMQLEQRGESQSASCNESSLLRLLFPARPYIRECILSQCLHGVLPSSWLLWQRDHHSRSWKSCHFHHEHSATGNLKYTAMAVFQQWRLDWGKRLRLELNQDHHYVLNSHQPSSEDYVPARCSSLAWEGSYCFLNWPATLSVLHRLQLLRHQNSFASHFIEHSPISIYSFSKFRYSQPFHCLSPLPSVA